MLRESKVRPAKDCNLHLAVYLCQCDVDFFCALIYKSVQLRENKEAPQTLSKEHSPKGACSFFFAWGKNDASEHGTDGGIHGEHARDFADLALFAARAAVLQICGRSRFLRFENGKAVAARTSPRTWPRTSDCAGKNHHEIKKGGAGSAAQRSINRMDTPKIPRERSAVNAELRP